MLASCEFNRGVFFNLLDLFFQNQFVFYHRIRASIKPQLMDYTSYKKTLLMGLHEILRTRGFKRKNNIFSASNGDLSYYICLQSNINSTVDTLITTVNIEMASAELYRIEEISIPEELYRSSVKNIGEYAGLQRTKWWTIHDEQSLLKAQQEIAAILLNKILPDIELPASKQSQGLFSWIKEFRAAMYL
jgi:hypothetical protein